MMFIFYCQQKKRRKKNMMKKKRKKEGEILMTTMPQIFDSKFIIIIICFPLIAGKDSSKIQKRFTRGLFCQI